MIRPMNTSPMVRAVKPSRRQNLMSRVFAAFGQLTVFPRGGHPRNSSGHSGLAFSDARAGIMAAGTILGTQRHRLLAPEAGGHQVRDCNGPE
jgi:hypothetical protein